VFSGWYAVSLDEKGRVAVPASFRHALAKFDATGPLYLTPFSHDGKPHLEVFPSAEFARLAEQIQNLEDSEQAELLKQEIIGRSVAVELDGQGRIVLPQWLREESGLLNGRVVVEGQISRFDIWDESRYQARRAEPERVKQALKLIKR
jgi:MraZ protein